MLALFLTLTLSSLQGRLAVGSDADIVVWDPEASKILSVKEQVGAADFNIFEGLEVHGLAAVVISNGRVVVDDEGIHTQQGQGRYIPTPPNAHYVYGRVAARDQV